jgi:parvulin-like peptidyl-prolyl isomerase
MSSQLFKGIVLSCAMVATGLAQTGQPGAPLAHAPKPGTTTELPATAASVGQNDPVITLTGACTGGTTGCVSSISREQFEKLVNVMKPNMTVEQRRNFAQQYARLVALSDQARAIGLQNDPKFQEVLQFATNQILVEMLNQHYSEEYSHPSDQQIQDYYNQNLKKYAEANLQRIIIPSEPASAEAKKPTPEEQKAYVEKARQQWVGGADPVALQKDAMTRMGLTSSPDVNLNNQRVGMIPPDQESVFDLKPGEISQPFTDTAASYIYKVVSTKQVPLDDVKAQIAKTLHDLKMREKIQQMNESIKPVLSEAYFGPEKPVVPPGGPGPEQGAAQQPAAPATSSNSAPSPK